VPVAQSLGGKSGARILEAFITMAEIAPVVADAVIVSVLEALLSAAGGKVSCSEVRIGAMMSRETP
jgi:hypothetical protein